MIQKERVFSMHITQKTITFLFSEDKKQILLVKQGDKLNGITRIINTEHNPELYAIAATREKTNTEIMYITKEQLIHENIRPNQMRWIIDYGISDVIWHVYAGVVNKNDISMSDNFVWIDVKEVDKARCNDPRFADDVCIPLYASIAKSILQHKTKINL